jgi:hypothetical protein
LITNQEIYMYDLIILKNWIKTKYPCEL